ncbi:MAG TPA: ABC transporter permease [Thermoanaerobaculia bacterium]
MTVAVSEYDSAARRNRGLEEILDLRDNLALIGALIDRNLKVRYKRSALGFLWTMVNPAVMLVALSLAFTRAFSQYAPAYPAYVFPGLLLWNFFAQTTTMIGEEVAASGELSRRVRFPKSAIAIAMVVSGVINLMLGILPLLAVLAIAHRPLGPALLSLPLTIALASVFVLGASLIVATGALYYGDVMPAWSMVLPAAMLMTPVVYPAAILPQRVQSLMRFNPMTYFVDGFRAPLYSNRFPEGLVMMLGIAAVTVVIGWIVFTRAADDIAYRV